MNITDLTDPVATSAYLRAALTLDPDIDGARALVDDALSFAQPPVGAHVVAARLAELAGDVEGFERSVCFAMGVDPAFEPALDDAEFLTCIRRGPGTKAGARRRALHLFDKLDRFSGRPQHVRTQLDFARAALGCDDAVEHGRHCLLIAETNLFLALLAFEGGLLDRFDATWGGWLPASERELLRSWRGARHRRYRLEAVMRARATLLDVEAGEVIEVEAPLRDRGWHVGEEAVALVVPVGPRATLIGAALVLDDWRASVVAAAMHDPMALAQACLRMAFVDALLAEADARDARCLFVFPDLDPVDIDHDEAAILDLVRRRNPDLAARADAGEPSAEADLYLEAIVAHRIITRFRPHTWALAERLLDLGGERESVLGAVREVTRAELWHLAREDDAA